MDEEVDRVLRDFHGAKKVIGMCCIAPIIAALVLGKSGVQIKITLGKKGKRMNLKQLYKLDLSEDIEYIKT